MRPAMQGQSNAKRGRLVTRKEEAVAAKIVEADTLAAQPIEQTRETTGGVELPRQQVMALHARLIVRFAAPIDGTKGQAAPAGHWPEREGWVPYPCHTRTKWPLAEGSRRSG